MEVDTDEPDGSHLFPIKEAREMKLHYLIVAGNNRLQFIRRRDVEAIWRGAASVAAFGCEDNSELRLVSVVSDRRFLPRQIYLLRIGLTDGYFARHNLRALRSHTMREHVTTREVFQHHGEGWPSDFFTQLAVALDVPRTCLDVPFGVGGPLLIAAARRISPRRAIRYLE